MPTYIKMNCTVCNIEFEREKRQHTSIMSRNVKNSFCSRTCRTKHDKNGFNVECLNCKKTVYKIVSACKNSPNHFCSRSCSATYTNTHKTTGSRRSKLEVWIEEKFKNIYENVNILYNSKTLIKSELDIYIPNLNIAFELNGILHYKPIYGDIKLQKIKDNDNKKYQACIDNNIELFIIDVSELKYFKDSNCMIYLNIIKNIIDNKINQLKK